MKTTERNPLNEAIDALSGTATRQLYTMLRGESTSADLFAAMGAEVDSLASKPNALPRPALNALARFAVAAVLEAGWGKDAADKWMAANLGQ